MPTIEDLRAVLFAREDFAGDPDTVRAHLARPPRRHVLAPALAAAAVVALAAGAVTLASVGGEGGTAPSTDGRRHWHGLWWEFNVDHVDGYQITRATVTPETQTASVVPTAPDGPRGVVTVHPGGGLPEQLGTGTAVTVGGHDGVFVGGRTPRTSDASASGAWSDPDTFARLRWQYAPDAWAEVAGTFGYDPVSGDYDNEAALREEQRLASAVRFDLHGFTAVMMPFRLPQLPHGLVPVAAYPGRTPVCADYVPYDALGSDAVLTACRYPVRVGFPRPGQGDRQLTVSCFDATSLTLHVDREHADEISAEELSAIARSADTMMPFYNRHTWLPIS